MASQVAGITGTRHHTWLIGCKGLTFLPGLTSNFNLLIAISTVAGIIGKRHHIQPWVICLEEIILNTENALYTKHSLHYLFIYLFIIFRDRDLVMLPSLAQNSSSILFKILLFNSI
jgi:hypothetical protein